MRTRGGELGARYAGSHLSASLVGYWLRLDSELVFSGDEGSTEPNAASRRWGAEVTLFWRPLDRLAIDAAAGLTRARFVGVAAGEDRIPNAVGAVLSGGAPRRLVPNLDLSARIRHFRSAPLVEDDSARSRPTTLVNLGAYLTSGKSPCWLEVLNALDSRANDITYYCASRLPGEAAGGIDDYHVHPVEPRQFRISLRRGF